MNHNWEKVIDGCLIVCVVCITILLVFFSVWVIGALIGAIK